MHDDVWRRAGFDAFDGPPGQSDVDALDPLRRRCSPTRSTGTRCWRTTRGGSASPRSATRRWPHGNVVLLGDAAHTAHFSIGSGTKLAMEDALALAACLHEHASTSPAALAAYEAERRPVVRVHPARGAGEPGVVREPRAVHAPGADAVRVQHHDPLAAGSPTTTCGARSGVRRSRGRRGSPPRGGCRRRPAADVPAVPDRWARAEQPGRGVGDGHVRRRRRPARTTSTWPTWAARRSAAPGW